MVTGNKNSSEGRVRTFISLLNVQINEGPRGDRECSVQDTDLQTDPYPHFADGIDEHSKFSPLPIKWSDWPAVRQTGGLNKVRLPYGAINHHRHMGNMTSNPQVIPPWTQVFSFYHFCCWCAHCCTFVSAKQPRIVSPPKHTDVPHQSHKDNLSCWAWAQAHEETCKSHFSLFSILSDCNTVRAEETLNPADWIRPRSKPTSSPAASAPCCVSVLWTGHRSRRPRRYVFINTSSSWSPEKLLRTSSPPEPPVGLVYRPGCDTQKCQFL